MRYLQYLKLSFYGHRRAHDQVMGCGHYDRLMALGHELVRHGGPVGANVVLVSGAVGSIRNVLMDAAKNQFGSILFMSYIPSRVYNTDRKYDPRLDSQDICTLIEAQRDLLSRFPEGVKLHYYADDYFYVVLDEDGYFTLPCGGRTEAFQMGHIDPGLFTIPVLVA